MSRKRKQTKPAAPEAVAEDPSPCTPEVRRRPDLPPGVPVVLADGREWSLPFSGLNPVRSGPCRRCCPTASTRRRCRHT